MTKEMGYYSASFTYYDNWLIQQSQTINLCFDGNGIVLLFDEDWIWGPYQFIKEDDYVIFADDAVKFECQILENGLRVVQTCVLDENTNLDWMDRCPQFHSTSETFVIDFYFIEGEYNLPDTGRTENNIETENAPEDVQDTRPYFSRFEEDTDLSVRKMLKADIVLYGLMGGDGMRMVRSQKTKKWGVYQVIGDKYSEFNPMEYDSLRSFYQNSFFTIVYKEGKAGVYLAAWSYGDKAKQTVPCIYDDYRIVEDNRSYPVIPYLMVKQDGKWAWIDWLHGEIKSKFSENLSYLPFEQQLTFSNKSTE